MNKEQEYFLQIISDHLHSKPTVECQNIDWNVITEYANNHQLAGIVYYQCKKFMPQEYAQKLEKQYASAVYYHSNRVMSMNAVEKAFTNFNINFITVKGLDVAKCYPKPALRTMGDIDIIVHTEDRDKADKAFSSLGFTVEKSENFEWHYYKNDLMYELHERLLYDLPGNDEKKKELTGTIWNYTKSIENTTKMRLNDSFHFLFLLIHLRTHLVHMGVGFRQFMDLVVFSQSKQLNIEWLTKTFKEAGLYDFAQTSMALCEKWFNVEMPFTKDIDTDFYNLATDKIFNNGVFGFDNSENIENSDLYRIRSRSKFSLIKGMIFPSYKDMRQVQYYSFVDKKPYLLPVAWMYRYYRLIRYGVDDGRKSYANDMIVNDKNQQFDSYLKKWGL